MERWKTWSIGVWKLPNVLKFGYAFVNFPDHKWLKQSLKHYIKYSYEYTVYYSGYSHTLTVTFKVKRSNTLLQLY